MRPGLWAKRFRVQWIALGSSSKSVPRRPCGGAGKEQIFREVLVKVAISCSYEVLG